MHKCRGYSHDLLLIRFYLKLKSVLIYPYRYNHLIYYFTRKKNSKLDRESFDPYRNGLRTTTTTIARQLQHKYDVDDVM